MSSKSKPKVEEPAPPAAFERWALVRFTRTSDVLDVHGARITQWRGNATRLQAGPVGVSIPVGPDAEVLVPWHEVAQILYYKVNV